MSRFYDVRLKEYVYSRNFKNASFKDVLEFQDDHVVSNDQSILSAEKAYFAWGRYEDVEISWNFDQGFIFDMESRLLPVLARMEMEWFKLDSSRLRQVWSEIETRIKSLEEEIYELVWERFNLNSPKQLQVILFDKLKIPTSKKIKTWFSVDNETLEQMGQKYTIANLILEHRWLRKLLTTYVEWLLKALNQNTKKVYTTFNQTWASTGRLSSENPNLQNIPAWGGYAQEIKSCFIPCSDDFKLLVADYSQVELRVLANLSGDPVLLEAFRNWEDIHMRTTKFLFWEKTITSEERRRAKTVNFWVVYWISWFWLSKQIWIWPAEATEYINKFYELYKWVRQYYDNLLDKARQNSYVETYFWRRRYIHNINDANRIIRWQAEREAMNMPIQGTAADVIKLAMIKIDEMLTSWWFKTKMILQVHDELVFELHKDELHLEKEIKKIMENVVAWDAKLLVEIGVWDNWKKAKN